MSTPTMSRINTMGTIHQALCSRAKAQSSRRRARRFLRGRMSCSVGWIVLLLPGWRGSGSNRSRSRSPTLTRSLSPSPYPFPFPYLSSLGSWEFFGVDERKGTGRNWGGGGGGERWSGLDERRFFGRGGTADRKTPTGRFSEVRLRPMAFAWGRRRPMAAVGGVRFGRFRGLIVLVLVLLLLLVLFIFLFPFWVRGIFRSR